MISKEKALGQIVRVSRKTEDQLGLFECSTIAVGEGIAGQFMDNEEGAVVPLSSMIEIVDPDEAEKEVRRWLADKERKRIQEVVATTESAQQEFSGDDRTLCRLPGEPAEDEGVHEDGTEFDDRGFARGR